MYSIILNSRTLISGCSVFVINVVHSKAVVDANDRVLEVREQIKMPPESNGMFGGEDRMGRVGFCVCSMEGLLSGAMP